jgi:Trk K+ transport system NAD-binding subunit
MRGVLVLILSATGCLLGIGVLVFRFSLGLSWSDSVYFVLTTITTVGYGDINLRHAPVAVKLFGNLLMLSGAASLAAIFGIITDFLLRMRLQELLGRRKLRMRNHVVVCGLGNVGIRVLKQLHKLGQEVVAVEKDEDCKFLAEARAMKVPLVVGDIRLVSTLHQANITEAKALIAVSDEDLANLEAALNARSVNEGIHTVLRIFDQNLADKVQSGLGIEVAFSTSAVAAPAFAMAAVDPSVVGSFFVGETLMLNMKLTVQPGTELATMTAEKLDQCNNIALLAHTCTATGQQQLYPSGAVPIKAGDVLVISTVPEFLANLHGMNTPK